MRTIVQWTLVVLLSASAAHGIHLPEHTAPPTLDCPVAEPPENPANTSCSPIDCGTGCTPVSPPAGGDFDLMALVHMKLHDIKVCIGNTNLGVNCPHPVNNEGHCGVAIHDLARYQCGAQLTAGFTRFRPRPKTQPALIGSILSNGVPNADLTHYCLLEGQVGACSVDDNKSQVRRAFAQSALIAGDSDDDGKTSCQACDEQTTECDNGCDLDLDEVEEFCGFHSPTAAYSPCGQNAQFSLRPGDPATLTLTGGTLDPGYRYQTVVVKPNSVVTLPAGHYEICSLSVEKGATVQIPATSGDVVLHVSTFSMGSSVTFGRPEDGESSEGDPMLRDCPDGPVRMLVLGYGEDDKRRFAFGDKSDVRGYFCGPARKLQLGQGTRVIGRVIAREIHGGEPTTFIRCPKS